MAITEMTEILKGNKSLKEEPKCVLAPISKLYFIKTVFVSIHSIERNIETVNSIPTEEKSINIDCL